MRESRQNDIPEYRKAGGWGAPRFEIKNYRFVDLAMMYYPDRDYDSAQRLFRREMHETRGMWKAMQAVGYKEHTRVLTRAQVKVIVKYLAPPY